MKIVFHDVTTGNDVTVKKYNNPPAHTNGITQSNISEYRWVIDGGSIAFGNTTEMRLKVSDLDGISDPSSSAIFLYTRSTEGSGNFTQVGQMSYDADNDELYHTIEHFSEYVIASNNEPLPVELTTFTAKTDGDVVVLNWATATEVNNYGFEIQRSVTGAQCSGYEKIGFVPGHGNSNSPKVYSYVDKTAPVGKVTYRLKQIDIDGASEMSNIVSVNVKAPALLTLKQNYPNPFNPTTEIAYSLPEAGKVTMAVFNVIGQKVAVLVNKNQEAGNYKVTFSAANLPSGIYFYKIQSGSFVSVKKMILMK
jgi:hypothetical protein